MKNNKIISLVAIAHRSRPANASIRNCVLKYLFQNRASHVVRRLLMWTRHCVYRFKFRFWTDLGNGAVTRRGGGRDDETANGFSRAVMRTLQTWRRTITRGVTRRTRGRTAAVPTVSSAGQHVRLPGRVRFVFRSRRCVVAGTRLDQERR